MGVASLDVLSCVTTDVDQIKMSGAVLSLPEATE